MNAWKWAAVVVIGWPVAAAVVGVFTGRWLADLRQYQADWAAEHQDEVQR